MLSTYHVSIKAEAVTRFHYLMGLGSSAFRYEKTKRSGEERVDTNFLSRVMHELVVRATEYSPVTGECWVRDDEVTRSVGISISYSRVMNTDPVSLRRLNECA